MPEQEVEDKRKPTLKLLVVDDSAMVRERLATLLSQIPAVEVVGHATDGYEAVSLDRELKPDVIVMDIKMPRKNGIHALQEIKKERLLVQIIILTNFADTQYQKICMDLGADHFFDKSNDLEKLQQVLKDAVRARLVDAA